MPKSCALDCDVNMSTFVHVFCLRAEKVSLQNKASSSPRGRETSMSSAMTMSTSSRSRYSDTYPPSLLALFDLALPPYPLSKAPMTMSELSIAAATHFLFYSLAPRYLKTFVLVCCLQFYLYVKYYTLDLIDAYFQRITCVALLHNVLNQLRHNKHIVKQQLNFVGYRHLANPFNIYVSSSD